MSSVVNRRREQRVLVMVITMVVCYLVCWLPYGVTALLATFGPQDLLTPEASITPSLLAKFSTVINPFIYIFMNKQVRSSRPCVKYTYYMSVLYTSLSIHNGVVAYIMKLVINKVRAQVRRSHF